MTASIVTATPVRLEQSDLGKWNYLELPLVAFPETNRVTWMWRVVPVDGVGEYWDFLGFWCYAQGFSPYALLGPVSRIPYHQSAGSNTWQRLERPDQDWLRPSGSTLVRALAVNIYDSVGECDFQWGALYWTP